MAEETEFTFAHFVDPELLEARVNDLGGLYSDEEVAATAFYLGVLSVTGLAQVVPLYGDTHFLMHVMSNIYAGEWLVEVIKAALINPTAVHEFVREEHAEALRNPATTEDGMEDIGPAPMDSSTFQRLWGGHGA